LSPPVPRVPSISRADLPTIPVDVALILRAITGLCLALGLFCTFAAFNDRYRNPPVPTTDRSHRLPEI